MSFTHMCGGVGAGDLYERKYIRHIHYLHHHIYAYNTHMYVLERHI